MFIIFAIYISLKKLCSHVNYRVIHSNMTYYESLKNVLMNAKFGYYLQKLVCRKLQQRI
jgi:hypothetical protein